MDEYAAVLLSRLLHELDRVVEDTFDVLAIVVLQMVALVHDSLVLEVVF